MLAFVSSECIRHHIDTRLIQVAESLRLLSISRSGRIRTGDRRSPIHPMIKGYHATTIDEIANKLGIAKPSIYYYVKSKEEILREIVGQITEPLEKAAKITGRFTPQTTGRHNLYIVLLSGLNGKIPGYGIYVGETSKSPEERFREHTEGKRNRKGPLFSRVVYRHHACLLPTLYNHLNPLSRKEAKYLEGKIAEALRLEEIPVYGGH